MLFLELDYFLRTLAYSKMLGVSFFPFLLAYLAVSRSNLFEENALFRGLFLYFSRESLRKVALSLKAIFAPLRFLLEGRKLALRRDLSDELVGVGAQKAVFSCGVIR